jgi:hypothetical protein
LIFWGQSLDQAGRFDCGGDPVAATPCYEQLKIPRRVERREFAAHGMAEDRLEGLTVFRMVLAANSSASILSTNAFRPPRVIAAS